MSAETKIEWRVCHRRPERGSSWRTRFYAVAETATTAADALNADGFEVRLQRREVTAWETVPANEQVSS